MPTITRLQLQDAHKNRVNVFLDEEYAFSLALDLAATLRKGQDLSNDDIAALRAEDAYRRALDDAMHLLGYRPRTRGEIERRLAERDVEAGTIERVLARLVEMGLVDDAAFARAWVEQQSRFRPRGRRALRHELSVRGVPAPIIDDAIADVDEPALARRLALEQAPRHSGLDRQAQARKLAGYLERRGFGVEAVRAAIEAARDGGREDA